MNASSNKKDQKKAHVCDKRNEYIHPYPHIYFLQFDNLQNPHMNHQTKKWVLSDSFLQIE